MVVSASLRLGKALVEELLKQGKQRIKESFRVKEHHGLGVSRQLLERNNFQNLLQCAEATRQRDKCVGALFQERLPFA